MSATLSVTLVPGTSAAADSDAVLDRLLRVPGVAWSTSSPFPAVLTLSTPVREAAAEFVLLFDAVVSTFRWRWPD